VTTGSRRQGALPVVWLVVALVVALLSAVAVVVLLRDGTEHAVLRDRSAAASGPDEGAATTELLESLEDEVVAGDAAAAEELADPADARARRELRTLVLNAERLRLEDVAFRYLTEAESELTAAEQQRFGTDAWVSDVQVSWRVSGADPATSSVDLPLVTSWTGEEPVFESFRTGSERVPLWLLTALQRRSAGPVTVLGPRAQLSVLARQAALALRTVQRTVPGWRGPLVVEAAPDGAAFRKASGLTGDAAAQIAAVTATTDGSALPDAPVHVFLNPEIHTPLGPEGQQIVLSHEAAHVALGAVGTSAPLWLSEGVADYVALVDSPIPVTVLAAQILGRVREQGPPRRLPGSAEFDGTDDAIGAWYEAAWLAARLLADEYGERRLFDLYRRTNAGTPLDDAMRDVLGTTEGAFVRQWRDHLDELAG
jgi:hypothetical protein